jgi:nitroimidazol reductase NimA-like FMN-containing flavoprotein (pyridoxamine 5'-phosphate oxidase superfamily)
MRRAEREIVDRKAQEAVLDAAPVLRLGLLDGAEPYIVPLNFVRLGSSLFFHSAPEGRKIDLIRARPRVCFEAEGECRVEVGETPCDCTTRYKSVIGWGTASFVERAEEKSVALAALNRKFGAKEGPFPQAMLSRVAVIRIDIDRMTGKANLRP